MYLMLGKYIGFKFLFFMLFLILSRFGPVNLFWSTRYDKAMTLFATCLKDFAEFAHSKDLENNIPPDKHFKLPYK